MARRASESDSGEKPGIGIPDYTAGHASPMNAATSLASISGD